VLAGIGGFGALFEVPVDRFRSPVLVSGTDGVGTKLRLAIAADAHDGVGVDLVAMCVNDVVSLGAEPLFFLDYLATGRLDLEVAERVVAGIAHGCEQAGAALVGGETAEMPGMYADGDYDLAGFCVGVVERDLVLDGSAVRPGDVVIGIASSGLHSNGYSLVRRILEDSGASLDAPLGDATLGEALLAPTRVYARSALALVREAEVRAVAHVTGGGIVENVPRVLPAETAARVDPTAWPRPAVFDWIQEAGGVSDDEMWRTFNCGIGLVVVVAGGAVEAALRTAEACGETAWVIGEVALRAEGEAGGVLG